MIRIFSLASATIVICSPAVARIAASLSAGNKIAYGLSSMISYFLRVTLIPDSRSVASTNGSGPSLGLQSRNQTLRQSSSGLMVFPGIAAWQSLTAAFRFSVSRFARIVSLPR